MRLSKWDRIELIREKQFERSANYRRAVATIIALFYLAFIVSFIGIWLINR
jgi:hypothetical protein